MSEQIIEQPLQGQQVDAEETRNRRRARSIVAEAMRGAGTPLDNRGLGQYLLPGLWYAAVNVLIHTLEPRDIVDLLTDRQRGILGSGDNAASPPRSYSPKQMRTYVAGVTEAGKTIMECLMPALDRLEEEGLEDRFPESVLDSALLVLLKAWGPDHVRRAMTEQAALLIKGTVAPANFMEPTEFMPQQPPRETQREAPVPPAPPAASVLPSPPRRLQAARSVAACVLADLSADGMGAWAVSIRSFSDARDEERLIYGTCRDPNGRAAWLTGLRECVLAVCADVERARGRIDVADEHMVRAATGAPGTRYPAEEQAWADIDAALACHDLTISHVQRSISNEGFEMCDRKIRFLLSGG